MDGIRFEIIIGQITLCARLCKNFATCGAFTMWTLFHDVNAVMIDTPIPPL